MATALFPLFLDRFDYQPCNVPCAMFIAQAQAFQCRKYMNIAGKQRQLKRREYAQTPPVRVCFVIIEEVSLCLCCMLYV